MTSLRKLGRSDLEVFPLSLGGNVFGWTADSYSAFAPGNQGGESETIIGWGSPRPKAGGGSRPAATAPTSSSPPRSASTPTSGV